MVPAKLTSPSSRRAWIEIHEKVVREWLDYVALLAEGVDRNYPYWFAWAEFSVSPSSRRAWIEMSLATNTG